MNSRFCTNWSASLKDSLSKPRESPFKVLEQALQNGWQTVDTIPLAGDGSFMVITLTGKERRAKNRSSKPTLRRADGWGPKRTTVVAIPSGNYLGAIAWRWPDSGS